MWASEKHQQLKFYAVVNWGLNVNRFLCPCKESNERTKNKCTKYSVRIRTRASGEFESNSSYTTVLELPLREQLNNSHRNQACVVFVVQCCAEHMTTQSEKIAWANCASNGKCVRARVCVNIPETPLVGRLLVPWRWRACACCPHCSFLLLCRRTLLSPVCGYPTQPPARNTHIQFNSCMLSRLKILQERKYLLWASQTML